MQLATHTPVPDSIAKFAAEDTPDAMQSRYSEYKIIRRNGAVVGFEPSKISIAMTKAFIAVNGGQGAASARVREIVAKLTDAVVGALMRRQPSGGTFPHRGHPGPGRARADAFGRARSRARLCAVSRAALAGTRQAARSAGANHGAAADQRHRKRQIAPARHGEAHRAGAGVVRRPGPRGRCRSDPAGHAERPVRRRADRGSAQVADPVGARADRERPGLQLRHRAPAAAHAAARDGRRGTHAGRHEDALRRGVPAADQERHRSRAARRAHRQLRSEKPGRGARRQARFQVRLPRAADPVRPLFPARARHAHRTAADVFHARRDGARAERTRRPARSARDRVLQRALVVRFHELDADAVQLRRRAARSSRAAT